MLPRSNHRITAGFFSTKDIKQFKVFIRNTSQVVDKLSKLYPPSRCLMRNEIFSYFNRVEVADTDSTSNSSSSISTNEEIDELLKNTALKISFKDYCTISKKIYYLDKNWRSPNSYEIDEAHKIYPSINLDNVLVKQSPFEKNQVKKKKTSKKSSNFGNIYEIMDRQCALFSIQKDWSLLGINGAYDLLASDVDPCFVSSTSICYPERDSSMWRRPWKQEDTYKTISLLLNAIREFNKSEYFRTSRIYHGPFFKNSIVFHPLLVDTSLKSVPDATKPLVNKALLFNKEVEALINEINNKIPRFSDWKNIDVKSLAVALPHKSQRQVVEQLCTAHMIFNIYLIHAKTHIIPKSITLSKLLSTYISLYSLCPVVSNDIGIKAKDDYVQFEIPLFHGSPLELKVKYTDLSTPDISYDFIRRISSFYIDKRYQLRPPSYEIDELYIEFRHQLSKALTSYCKSLLPLSNLKKKMPNYFHWINKKFNRKSSLRNMLFIEIYLKANLYETPLTDHQNRINFTNLSLSLNPDKILEFVFKNRKENNIDIPRALLPKLYEKFSLSKEPHIGENYYKEVSKFFKDQFPYIFDEYLRVISGKISKIKSRRRQNIIFRSVGQKPAKLIKT